jgi:hypothetical protein
MHAYAAPNPVRLLKPCMTTTHAAHGDDGAALDTSRQITRQVVVRCLHAITHAAHGDDIISLHQWRTHQGPTYPAVLENQ